MASFAGLAGPTAFGWTDEGLRFVLLPEHDEATTRSRVTALFPTAREREPTAVVQAWLERVGGMLARETTPPDFLADIPLALEGVPDFAKRVYESARRIAPGETLTYGEIAHRLGSPGAARAVGGALGRNPVPIVVPCHRVLAANGKIGGFSGAGGIATKRALLALERGDTEIAGPLFATFGSGRKNG